MITSSDGDQASGSFDYKPLLVLEMHTAAANTSDERRETLELLPEIKIVANT